MDQIHGASELCDLFSLPLQLLLNLCGARQLRVQSLPRRTDLQLRREYRPGPSGDRLGLVVPLVPLARALLVRHVSRCGSATSAALGLYRASCLAASLTPKTAKGATGLPADKLSKVVHVIRIATEEIQESAQPKTVATGRPLKSAAWAVSLDQ